MDFILNASSPRCLAFLFFFLKLDSNVRRMSEWYFSRSSLDFNLRGSTFCISQISVYILNHGPRPSQMDNLQVQCRIDAVGRINNTIPIRTLTNVIQNEMMLSSQLVTALICRKISQYLDKKQRQGISD